MWAGAVAGLCRVHGVRLGARCTRVYGASVTDLIIGDVGTAMAGDAWFSVYVGVARQPTFGGCVDLFPAEGPNGPCNMS
eukprot:5371673-Pyramimonas_sp.AAC.1